MHFIKVKFLSIVLTFLTVKGIAQQQIKTYVQQQARPIRSIEPDSMNFSDLVQIGDAIGNSRIVMLGEQDHGDAPTFLAKTRLIKYLHEKKGFNVIAFENDFFALNQGWDALLKQNKQIIDFMQQNIFTVWSNCQQCGNLLYHYIPQSYYTKNPIQVTGFDPQVHGQYSNQLPGYLTTFLKKNSVSFANKTSYVSSFLPFLDSLMVSKNPDKYRLFAKQIDTLINQLPKPLAKEFGTMVLQNLKAYCLTALSSLTKERDSHEPRDLQMSENLKWLVNQKYPNEKIIVWAHSAHIVKNNQLIRPNSKSDNWISMGHYFTQDSTLIKQSYVLGFTSKVGTAGRVTDAKTYRVLFPAINGFEYWLNDDWKYAFVDFRAYKGPKEYFNMKGKHHLNNEAVWTAVFDGIFYIRDMYPCDDR